MNRSSEPQKAEEATSEKIDGTIVKNFGIPENIGAKGVGEILEYPCDLYVVDVPRFFGRQALTQTGSFKAGRAATSAFLQVVFVTKHGSARVLKALASGGSEASAWSSSSERVRGSGR